MSSFVGLSNLDFAIRWAMLALALYRVAWDLAEGHGIFNWCDKLRAFIQKRTGPSSWLRDFIRCPLCWSMTIALAVVPVFFPILSAEGYVLVVCSVSGGALLIHYLTYRWITA